MGEVGDVMRAPVPKIMGSGWCRTRRYGNDQQGQHFAGFVGRGADGFEFTRLLSL